MADIHTSRVLLRHGEIPAGGWRCFWITGSMVQTGKMTAMQAAAKGHDGHLAQLSQAVGRGLHFDHPVLEGRQRRHHQCQCLDQLNRMGGRAPIPANDKSSAFNSVVAGSVTIFTIQVNINNADARSQALQIARPVGTSKWSGRLSDIGRVQEHLDADFQAARREVIQFKSAPANEKPGQIWPGS